MYRKYIFIIISLQKNFNLMTQSLHSSPLAAQRHRACNLILFHLSPHHTHVLS
jgi:hypothetical protein